MFSQLIHLCLRLSVVLALLLPFTSTQATVSSVAHWHNPLQQSGNKPNIVLIIADDLADDPQMLQAMPNLQRLLVAQGMSFANAITTVPSCCPSRASILTGKYAHNHRVASNAPPSGGFPVFYRGGQEAVTVGTVLKGAGYRTVLLGKYLNHYPLSAPSLHIPPGWSSWYAHLDGDLFTNYVLNENGVQVTYGERAADYSTDVYARHTVNFINQQAANTPFFVMLDPYAPHSPALPAPRHAQLFANVTMVKNPGYDEADLSDKPKWVKKLPRLTPAEKQTIEDFYRLQLRSVQAVDDLIADVVNALTATGRLNNTYIIFTSDNGLHHGEHRIIYGKGTAYEEAIRVPFVVRGPGIAPGSRTTAVITLADLLPTFAQLAGAPAQNNLWDGRSLVPLFTNPTTTAWRSAVFFTSPNALTLGATGAAPGQVAASGDLLPVVASSLAITQTEPVTTTGDTDSEDGALIVAARSGGMAYHGFRTKSYKYVEYKNGDKELYDLVNDPYELNNQFKFASATLRSALAARLQAFRNCVGNACRVADSAAPVINFPLGAASLAPLADESSALPAESSSYQLYLPTVMVE